MKRTEIEIHRNNVTPAQFMAYVRSQCKRKGMSCDVSTETFATGQKLGRDYWHTNYRVENNCRKSTDHRTGVVNLEEDTNSVTKTEITKLLPYDYQTYCLNFDGSCYNEIIEFTFDDEKTGHGYYYQLNVIEEEGNTTEEKTHEKTLEKKENKKMYNEKHLANLISKKLQEKGNISLKSLIVVTVSRDGNGKKGTYQIEVGDYLQGKEWQWNYKGYTECYAGVNDLLQSGGGTVEIIPEEKTLETVYALENSFGHVVGIFSDEEKAIEARKNERMKCRIVIYKINRMGCLSWKNV